MDGDAYVAVATPAAARIERMEEETEVGVCICVA